VHDGVAGTGILGLGDDLFGEAEAVFGEEVCSAEDALLEDAAGVERLRDGFSMSAERSLALQLKVCREAAQRFIW